MNKKIILLPVLLITLLSSFAAAGIQDAADQVLCYAIEDASVADAATTTDGWGLHNGVYKNDGDLTQGDGLILLGLNHTNAGTVAGINAGHHADYSSNEMTWSWWWDRTSDSLPAQIVYEKFNGGADTGYTIQLEEGADNSLLLRFAKVGEDVKSFESIPAENTGWHNYIVSWNDSGCYTLFIDGSMSANSCPLSATFAPETIRHLGVGCGGNSNCGSGMSGLQDNFMIWKIGYTNGGFNNSNAQEIYNAGAGVDCSFSPPVIEDAGNNLKISVSNANTFNATVNNTLFTTTTGSLTTTFWSNETDYVNVSISAYNYFNQTFLNYNLTTDINTTLSSYPTLTVYNRWNNDIISNYTVTINGTTYNSINNTTYIPQQGTFNITVASPNYYSLTQEITLLENQSYNATTMYQSVLNLIPREIYSNSSIAGGTFTYGSQTISNGDELYLGTGPFNVTFTHPDYFSLTQEFTVAALDNVTNYLIDVYNSYVNVVAHNGITNASLTSFNVTNPFGLYTTTNGTITIPWLYNLTTNLSFSSTGYAGVDYNYTFLPNESYLNASMFTENSVFINIYDEDTGLFIDQNTSIRITSSIYEGEVFTDGSHTYFFDNLVAAEYQFYFYTTNYSARTYTVTIGEGSTQDLSVYLTTATDTTIFTVYDADKISTTIEGAYASMYRLYNSTWMPVESKVTDVVGTAQFVYSPTANYKFVFTKSGYDNNIFYLNPILYDSYNIQLTQTTLINYTADFDDLIILYAPGQFDNGTLTDFQFLFSSPEGELLNYGFNLSHPGGETILSGTNALGSQLGANVTVEADSVFDFVILTYYYETVLSGQREFIALLPINFASESGAGNFATQQDETYGLGIFERVFIITLVLLFVVGIAALVGMPIEGLLLAMLIGGYMSYIGFIDLWIILPSLLLGFFYVIWKTGE